MSTNKPNVRNDNNRKRKGCEKHADLANVGLVCGHVKVSTELTIYNFMPGLMLTVTRIKTATAEEEFALLKAA